MEESVLHTEPAEAPVLAPEPTVTAPQAPMPMEWSGPTYHISLWDTPPTYLCLVCNLRDVSLATIEAHIPTEHQLEALPSVLAQDYSVNPPAFRRRSMPEPTYRTEETQDGTKYLCLHCERAGSGHWSYDRQLFEQHMQQRHDGSMIEDTAVTSTAQSEHPHGGPPGQTGEHPEHPHGGPPGQTGEHPHEEPHTEHPIVLPDEDDKPEAGA